MAKRFIFHGNRRKSPLFSFLEGLGSFDGYVDVARGGSDAAEAFIFYRRRNVDFAGGSDGLEFLWRKKDCVDVACRRLEVQRFCVAVV